MYCVDCTNGQVRLMNGSQPSLTEGRVEICYNNTYGTVCDDFFDETAASIVCGGIKGWFMCYVQEIVYNMLMSVVKFFLYYYS